MKLLMVALICGLVFPLKASVERPLYSRHQRAFFLDANQVAFVRPGLQFTIQSAGLTADFKPQVTFKITDDNGLPLDREGIYTPGSVSTSFVLARIPKGESQYVAYTTRTQTSPITGVSAIQAAADSGGAYERLSEGVYRYTFGTAIPADYDTTVTHTVVMYGSRNLTEFDLGTQYDNAEFTGVPDGSPVTVVRDVVRTETCNKCHDPLAEHGGSRREVLLCNTCHTPQTSDPDTGNTVDMKVMIHKIHAGPDLPSVQAGKPYIIIGNNQGVNDFSHTTYPQEINYCQTCHDGSGSQDINWLTKPTRATCGSCHDDVNFATGEGHAAGQQPNDDSCSRCHIPEGELEFDASIKGAHTIPRYSRDLPGVNFEILGIANTKPGERPAVTLKITDKQGFPIETSQMNSLSLLISGPNTDYASYWRESALETPSQNGMLTYTFQQPIPADAKGSYSVAVEGYRFITLQPGTTTEVKDVRDAGFNKILSFAVTDSTPVARRSVITTQNCNTCHGTLAEHGSQRLNVEYCQFCHNANETGDNGSIHFKTLIHKIHTGEDSETESNFSEVKFPGDRRNCVKCHLEDTQQLPPPKGSLPTVAPGDFINPMLPATAACLSCHSSQEAASHALVNTSTLGESCTVCHGTSAQFSVDKSHAR
jgi:OmcA/MtrC family decaheme c-type cytochrome